jgi:hypothetical protein
MAGYLLYCNPGLFPMQPKTWLGGELLPDGQGGTRKVAAVSPYNNFNFGATSADTKMKSLNKYLLKYPGTAQIPTRVVGHSLGSQIIYKWIREMGPVSAIDPATVEFYTTGCPEMKYTGAAYLYPVETKPNYPGTQTPHTGDCPTPVQFHNGWGWAYGVPDIIPWKLWCIAAQYDGWADAPNNLNNAEVSRETKKAGWFSAAQLLWSHSMTCYMKSMSGPHGGYTSIPLSDATRNFTYQDPVNANVKYVWQMTYPIPSIKFSLSQRFTARDLDMARRPILEQAYTHRPIVIPSPNYAALVA